MPKINHNISPAAKRRRRVRGKIKGTAQRPRVSVHRSNHYTYAQVIDDQAAVTIAASSDRSVKERKNTTKTQRALEAGRQLAEKLKAKRIDQVKFDRGSYRFHGRVKAVAEGLRGAGIKV